MQYACDDDVRQKWIYFHPYTTKNKKKLYIMTFYRFSIFMIALLYGDGLRISVFHLYTPKNIMMMSSYRHHNGRHTQLSRHIHTHTHFFVSLTSLSQRQTRQTKAHTIKMDILHHFKEHRKLKQQTDTCMAIKTNGRRHTIQRI